MCFIITPYKISEFPVCWPEINSLPDISLAKLGLFGTNIELQLGV